MKDVQLTLCLAIWKNNEIHNLWHGTQSVKEVKLNYLGISLKIHLFVKGAFNSPEVFHCYLVWFDWLTRKAVSEASLKSDQEFSSCLGEDEDVLFVFEPHATKATPKPVHIVEHFLVRLPNVVSHHQLRINKYIRNVNTIADGHKREQSLEGIKPEMFINMEDLWIYIFLSISKYNSIFIDLIWFLCNAIFFSILSSSPTNISQMDRPLLGENRKLYNLKIMHHLIFWDTRWQQTYLVNFYSLWFM